MGFAQASARHLSSLRSRAAPGDLNSGAKNTYHRGGLNGTRSNLVLERAEMLLHRQGESPPRAKPTLAPPSRHNLPDSDTGRPWSRCHSAHQAATAAPGAAATATVGVYGMVHYSTQQRTREFGIRSALGAEPRSLVLLVLRRTWWLKGIRAHPWPGALVGSLHVLRSLLYDAETFQVSILLVPAALLGLSSLIAGALPAAQVSRVDPMIALSAE